MIVWPIIKRALKSLAVQGMGIDPDRVIWARGKGPRLGGPWADIRIANVQTIGRDGRQVEIRQPPVVAGQEISLKALGTRSMLVTFRVFSSPGEDIPPEGVMERMVARSFLESALSSLNSAGIGLGGWDPIITLDGIVGDTFFEPRAQVNMRAFLSSEVEEFTTFIESVEMNVNDETRIVTEGDFDGE
jgi:hypothetical protein